MTVKFNKIYITGLMSAVNNIDLYFQEFFDTEKCEVLKPYFTKENIKINIKDYIEVNSAIALAMQGLGYGIKSMNFKKINFSDKIPEWLKADVSLGKKDGKSSGKISFDMKGKLDAGERWLVRGATGVFILMILFSILSCYIQNRINDKIVEAEETSLYTDQQIALAQMDIAQVVDKANEYKEMEDNLRNINQKIEDDLDLKGSIPNLLVGIMSVIPENVQVTDIENTSGNESRHIVIKAQSKYYDELGYFKAKLKEDGILNNIVSTQGEKQDDFVKIVIEGDLPWEKY